MYTSIEYGREKQYQQLKILYYSIINNNLKKKTAHTVHCTRRTHKIYNI
jgi:hypothetical protein